MSFRNALRGIAALLSGELMATIDDLVQGAQDESTVDDSIIALLNSIKAQLDAVTQGALPPDVQAKVDAIFATMQANKQKVAGAVTANTPAAPPSPPTS